MQTRLNFDAEPLNKVFAECLIKQIDLMGRKGCNRTGMEFCKLLFGLDPENDPYGVLLRIDYYSIRAREYKFLIKFLKQLPSEVYPDEAELTSYLVLPNFLMSAALAKRMDFLEDCEKTGLNTSKECCTESIIEYFQ